MLCLIFWLIVQLLAPTPLSSGIDSVFVNEGDSVVTLWKSGPLSCCPDECTYRIWSDDKSAYSVTCRGSDISVASYLPKNTTWFRLSYGNLSVITGSPFINLTAIKTLELANNRIGNIHDTVFFGLTMVEEMTLRNNFLKTLPDDLFLPCPNLKELDLSKNFIFRLELISRPLRVLQSLQLLNLQSNVMLNRINESEMAYFANTSLNHLNLDFCLLDYVAPNAFAVVTTLKELILSYNLFTDETLAIALSSLANSSIALLELKGLRKLSKFPFEALKHLSSTNINTLILSENSFGVIENELSQLQNLSTLELDSCELREIHENAFDTLPRLQHLSLKNNKLLHFPSTISNLEELRYLDLSKNVNPSKAQSHFLLQYSPFSKNSKLETLNLDDVKLERIFRNSFHGLINLKKLWLDNCQIFRITDFSFETLQSLTHLLLNENPLSNSVTNFTFVGLKNLKQLYINRGTLDINSSQLPFQHLHEVEVIQLRDNNLRAIPSAQEFAMMPKLDLLFLDRNNIVSWDKSKFPLTSNITYLNLKKNALFTITDAMQKDFTRVQNLDISENPFNCSSCYLEQFQQWRQSTTNVTLDNLQHTECANPEKFKGHSLFTVSDFDHCLEPIFNITRELIASLSVVLLIVLALLGIGYYFRWYVRYWWFLSRAKIKRLRQYKVNEYRYDAFVSYNENDRPWVLQNLLPKLETNDPNFRLCLHERDFEVGREIIDNIVESIDNSHKVLLLLSNNFLKSQWCTWEMNLAQFKLAEDARDALVLVMLEPIEKRKITPTLQHLMRTRTYLPWPHNCVQAQKLFWERLKQALHKPLLVTDNCDGQNNIV